MNFSLDEVDLQILRLMQDNARISNADLARELEMAPSAVLERVKKLEQKNVILQYNTAINPAAVNQKLLAFIFIKSKDPRGTGNSSYSRRGLFPGKSAYRRFSFVNATDAKIDEKYSRYTFYQNHHRTRNRKRATTGSNSKIMSYVVSH
jgi:DNA-binding Lrp family transcriptional regulator